MSSDRQSSYTEEVRPLLTAPSVPLWEGEIAQVVRGRRAFLVRRESVQGYIEGLWARSADARAAEQTFRTALAQVVHDWRPTQPEVEHYFAALLELIGAYHPPIGFIKVLGQIQLFGRFGLNVVDQRTPGTDLHLLALRALKGYFLTPPALGDHAPGFNPYVDMLRTQLNDPVYASHALARLVELQVLQPTDQVVADRLRENVERLRELLLVLLAPTRRARAGRDLAVIYNLMVSTGKEVDHMFVEAARKWRGRFERLIPVPVITFKDGSLIKFFFLPEELEEYMRQYNQETRIQALATALIESREPAQAKEKARELAGIFEETLYLDDKAISHFIKSVQRNGLQLAHDNAGPALYLPYGVVPLQFTHDTAFSQYMVRVRLGGSPAQEMHELLQKAKAVGKAK